MTTLTAPPTATRARRRRPGFGAVLRAEWIKLRTVRSTWWTLAAIFVLGAGLTVLICGPTPSGWPAPTPTSRPARSSPGG